MFQHKDLKQFFKSTLVLMWLLTSTQIFAATINITLQKSDQALSINFFHEKDLFPVFSYEKNSITARFYRAISHINTDANFNKLASIQYTQKDKRAIKIMLPNKHYRAETKTGTTHSLINLYTEKEPLKAPQNKNLVYTYVDDNTNPVISIPHSFDSLAIFKRNTELWIAMTGNVKSLTFGSKDKLKFRSIKSQDALILACDIGKLEYQKLRYGPNQTVEILLGNDASQITKQNDIEYEECKDQHIWKILSDYKICKVQDEQTKEHINIVTVKDLVFGQNQEQVFEDFHLQKSLQGLVFVWKAQPCPITDKANQIIVKKAESENANIHIESDLPWHYEGNFLNQKHELEVALKSSEKQEIQYLCTKRLANLHFSKGHYHEAAHLLDNFKDSELFAKEMEVQLLYAVANYMTNDIETAHKTINMINNQKRTNKREMLFWKNVINKNDMKKSILFDLDNFISEYHDEVYWKLTFAALEEYCKENKLSDTKALLSKLRSPEIESVQEKLLYYKAMLDYQMGNKKAAYKVLESLDTKPVQRSNRMMLKKNLTKLRYQDQQISLRDAIKELESSQIDRYDNQVEQDFLMYLADLYHEQNDLTAELRILKYVKDFLDFDPLCTPRIEDIYTQIFLSNSFLASLDPLRRLAIFYEFEDLMPTGSKGDFIALSIANNLIALGLLDQAEEILEHQIQYRTVGKVKEGLAENLAYVLLINNKQEKALSLLNTLYNETTSFEKHQKRLRLKSIAATLMHKYDLALQYVDHDPSKESFILKKEIFFRSSRWKEYIDLIKPYLLSIVTHKNPQISKATEQDILRFGICCMMQKETSLLKMFTAELAKVDTRISTSLTNLASNNPLETYQKLIHFQEINQLNDLLETYKSELLSTNLPKN